MELRDNILVSGNADSTVKVWNINTGQCLQTLQGSASFCYDFYTEMTPVSLASTASLCLERSWDKPLSNLVISYKLRAKLFI